jgi:hypothetical protein
MTFNHNTVQHSTVPQHENGPFLTYSLENLDILEDTEAMMVTA